VFLRQNDDPAPPWVWNKANVQSVGGGFLVVDNNSSRHCHHCRHDGAGAIAAVGNIHREPFSPATSSPFTTPPPPSPSTSRLKAAPLQELRFFVGARTGADQLMGNASVGMATLRRDGFASYRLVNLPNQTAANGADGGGGVGGSGVLTTRPLVFNGGYFFVNVGVATNTVGGAANTTQGAGGRGFDDANTYAAGGHDVRFAGESETTFTPPQVRVGLLDAATWVPVVGFELDACIPITTDGTRQQITWRSGTGGTSRCHLSVASFATLSFSINLFLTACCLSPSHAAHCCGRLQVSGIGWL
jgi:hypothetical protein